MSFGKTLFRQVDYAVDPVTNESLIPLSPKGLPAHVVTLLEMGTLKARARLVARGSGNSYPICPHCGHAFAFFNTVNAYRWECEMCGYHAVRFAQPGTEIVYLARYVSK